MVFGLDFLNLSYVVCSGNMVVRAFRVINIEKKSFSADDLCHTRYESPSRPTLVSSEYVELLLILCRYKVGDMRQDKPVLVDVLPERSALVHLGSFLVFELRQPAPR